MSVLNNISPWITDPRSESLAVRLISPGLWAGENLEIVSWGVEPISVANVKHEASTLANKALDGLKSLTARDVAKAAAQITAEAAADNVLHGVGAIEAHQSVSEIGRAAGPVDSSAPPAKAGYVIALTNMRLVFLEAITCITHAPRTDPVRWYAVHRAIFLPRNPPEVLPLRFSWTCVLWERQLDLHLEHPELPRLLRFGNYEIPQAPERARAIAAALGRDPGP